MTAITRETVAEIQHEIREAAKGILTAHGLKITNNRATFEETEVSLRLTINPVGHNKEAEAFKANADRFGMSADDLGRELQIPGGPRVTIIGLKPKNRKYPVIVQEVGTERRFKLPAAQTRFHIARTTEVA